MFRILIAVLTLILATAASAQTKSTIAYGPDRKQTMDLYVPKDARDAPIIVMLHGGAWRFGDKSNASVAQAKSAHYTTKGYVFVSVNTRLIPDATPVEQAQDLARAMAAVQRRAPQWGGDPNKLVLMGHSAGAHVAALLATRNDLQRAAGLDAWSGTVSLDTAALNVVGLMTDNPARLYRRAFGANPEFWKSASPMTYIERRDGPFLVVCSSRRDAPCPEGRAFLRKADARSRLIPVDMSHKEINAELGVSHSYTAAVDQWIDRLF